MGHFSIPLPDLDYAWLAEQCSAAIKDKQDVLWYALLVGFTSSYVPLLE
jgi:hypothetical protein